MSCMMCTSSGDQAEFTTEMAIHFPGRKNLNRPHVFVFTNVLVCLDCGFSQLTIPEAELQKLKTGDARSTTAS